VLDAKEKIDQENEKLFKKNVIQSIRKFLISLGNQDLMKFGQRNFDKITDNRKKKRIEDEVELDSELKLAR
jgi:hypothetical protein